MSQNMDEKRCSTLVGETGHSFGWATNLEGVVWRFFIKSVRNDELLMEKFWFWVS